MSILSVNLSDNTKQNLIVAGKVLAVVVVIAAIAAATFFTCGAAGVAIGVAAGVSSGFVAKFALAGALIGASLGLSIGGSFAVTSNALKNSMCKYTGNDLNDIKQFVYHSLKDTFMYTAISTTVFTLIGTGAGFSPSTVAAVGEIFQGISL